MSKSLSDSNELESAAGGLADRGMSMFVAVLSASEFMSAIRSDHTTL